MNRCEICEAPATHVCSGLDVPGLHFCATHAPEHARECPSVAKEQARVEEKERRAGDSRIAVQRGERLDEALKRTQERSRSGRFCPSVSQRAASKAGWGQLPGPPRQSAEQYLKATLQVIATMAPTPPIIAKSVEEFAALLQGMARAALDNYERIKKREREWVD